MAAKDRVVDGGEGGWEWLRKMLTIANVDNLLQSAWSSLLAMSPKTGKATEYEEHNRKSSAIDETKEPSYSIPNLLIPPTTQP